MLEGHAARDARRALRNREALPPLRTAPLENDPAVLRAHADEKAVRATTAAAIGLISALHGTPG